VREQDRVPVQEGALLGHGLASSLGQNGAPWPFHIFSSFLLFLFLFSYFFYIICKNASNQFKPLSEIF
jgi:hypothetical protein